MPLVLAAYLAFAAGLLLGFGGFAFPAGAIAVTVAAVAGLRRDLRGTALAALVSAGALQGARAERVDHACATIAVGAGVVEGTLSDPARPGRRVRAEGGPAGGCRLRATLVVARGEAAEGDRVRALGRVVRTAGGVLVLDASVTRLGGPGPALRLRLASARRIDHLFARDAPLARALLIADQRSIDPELRSRFADAGMIHLLSVSGLHVAIIAAAAELLLMLARVPRRAALWWALASTVLYVAVIGAPAPAVRSAVMLGAGAVSRLLQRPSSPWASLALGAAFPLIDPRTVLDLGYQLSVAGIAGLIAAGALARRLCDGRVDGWRRTVARDLLASAVSSLVSLPLVAWTFGRASLVAPLANAAAGPLFALLQPTLFLALLCAPLDVLASTVAGVARVQLAVVDLLAGAAASVPFAAISVAPTLFTAVMLGVASVAAIVSCVSRFPARAGIVAGTAFVVALGWPLLPRGTGEMELHAIDVGQGDALALRTPRGRWVVFDAGRIWATGDAGRSTVIPYLRRRGGDVEAFVLSHPHADHAGGAASVLRALRPKVFWDAAYVASGDAYRAALGVAVERGIEWRRVDPGDSLILDGVRVDFLAPDSAWTAALADPNEASTVARVQYGTVRFLLVGDAERLEEEWLMRRDPDALRADVLKVGHHGSATSSTPAFLDAVSPRVALISVGVANTYGHPSPRVVRELMARGAHVLRTDHLGHLVVRTDGRRLTVAAGGERWSP